MAIAPTANFEDYVMEVDFGAGFLRICGLTDVTVSRTNNTDTTEVPDCADESLPFYLQRAVRSSDATVGATGVWSLTHHQQVINWFNTGATYPVRITNAKVVADGASGDIEAETFPMILTALNNERTKGQVVTAELSMERNGATTFTAKA